ncbi:MAG: hypothetical protein ACUVUH_02990 [bacterium]
MIFIIIPIFTWFDWQVAKTENFELIYKNGYEYEALKALQHLEYYRADVVDLISNDTRPVPVAIEDIGTLSNGYANPVYYNIHFFTYVPGSASYLEGIEDWYRILSIHEFTHIAHMTRTNGIPHYLTGIFGSLFQPNMYSPGWIIEGITVYSESKISPFEGRLNDGFFDAYIRTCIAEEKFPDIISATNEPLSFPYGKMYLYGGKLFDFLAQKYGEKKFKKFFTTYGSYPWAPISAVFPGLGLDIAAKRVYGKTFPALFKEWEKYELSNEFVVHTEGKKITNKGWYISSLIADNGKLIFVRESAIKLDCFRYKKLWQIIELDPGTYKEKVLLNLNSQVTTRLKIYDHRLYFATAELKPAENIHYNGYGITSILYRFNLVDKKKQTLFTDDIRSFCVLDSDIIIYVKQRQHSFGSEIWLFTPELKKKIWEGDLLIDEIETNGKWIVVSARREFENPDLYIFKPESAEFRVILSTPWTEGHLSLAQTDWLGFIANFDGEHRIYAINLINPESIFCYTKGEFTNSFVFIKDTLYFSILQANGFDIYKKLSSPEKYYLKQWQSYPEPDFQKQRFEIKKGNYFDVVKTSFPSVRLPVFLPVDSAFRKWSYGVLFSGGDATDENIYITYLGRDPLNNKLFFRSNLQSKFFSPTQIELLYDYTNHFKISSSYPIFNTLKPGIANITLYLNFKSFDEYQRKEMNPGLALTWRKPDYNCYLNFYVPFESKIMMSSIDRIGFFCGSGLNYLFFTGELRTKITGFLDPQNPDSARILLRGYEPVSAQKGILFNTEYSHRLLELRKGLWNPNIYFEDLFGIIFFDYALTQNGKKYYSIGVEIALESKSCFGFIRMVPKAGLVINGEKRFKLLIELASITSEIP